MSIVFEEETKFNYTARNKVVITIRGASVIGYGAWSDPLILECKSSSQNNILHNNG